MSDSVIVIKNDVYEVGICPEKGGVITHFVSVKNGTKIDWLKPTILSELQSPIDALKAASFPLFPFSNRIANNKLVIENSEYQLTSNVDVWPLINHGHSWLGKWNIVEQTSSRAVIVFTFPNTSVEGCGWPYSYEAEQVFELNDKGLNVRLKLLNTSEKTMPAGMGMHPYFLYEPDMLVRFNSTGQWFSDELVIPNLHKTETDAVLNFRKGHLEVGLDNNFTGWDGKATLTWPSHGGHLTINASDIFRNVVVYSPEPVPTHNVAEKAFFCLEPVTHTTNSFNNIDLPDVLGGTQMLAPNESIQGDVQFTPHFD
ncbi:aldose 1-epimerase [Marinomonas sp. 15G1-11]|uniref:Aldose 1-epimerase n=1 Tax=Marinomonas phaeophyticola TaxID=3004091 RepID=A0ABT4JYF7_9GAMM|nr:aldose 1-epimerase [Marinomonas sp. 15G1-11]MCZ2723256.1 aldose 1-epimerase [Marinomonas sp. 15G1-11]